MAEPTIVVSAASSARSDRRKDWALIIVAGGGMAMTAYSIATLVMSSGNPKYVFYLGVMAMIQILIIFTGVLGLLVKRSLNVSRSGVSVSDFDPDDDDLIPRGDAVSAVEEAVQQIPSIDGTDNKPS